MPYTGQTLLYQLTHRDILQINTRRANEGGGFGTGSIPQPNDQLPLIVTHVFPDDELVNGQVLLDGDDSLWITGRGEGTIAGTWRETDAPAPSVTVRSGSVEKLSAVGASKS